MPGVFDLPAQAGNLLHALLIGGVVHRDPSFLAPLGSIASILNAVANGTYDGGRGTGSAAWAAQALAPAARSAATTADALGMLDHAGAEAAIMLRRSPPTGYAAYRLGYDDAWDGTKAFRAYFAYDEAAFTTEVRFTDRLFAFHASWRDALDASGDGGDFRSGKENYKPDRLYMAITGDVVAPNSISSRAVVWDTHARDLGVLVAPARARAADGHRAFVAKLYHFGPDPRPMGAVLHQLAPGTYIWSLVVNGTFASLATGGLGDNAVPVANGTLAVLLSRAATRVAFALPPRAEAHLGVFAAPD